MPKRSKDILCYSDTGDEDYDSQDVYLSPHQAVSRGKGSQCSKRPRTCHVLKSKKKGSRKRSAPTDVESMDDTSLPDTTPLTKDDIPTIVSAVLQSIRPSEVQVDSEPSVQTLAG